MRVLVTSARAPAALELARRFHARGDTVFLCDSLRFSLARFSRAKRAYCTTPRVRTAPTAYLRCINRFIAEHEIDLVVPTCEEVFYLAALRDQIACDVFVDRFDTLHAIHNKWTFSQAAGNEFANVPVTRFLASQEAVRGLEAECQQLVFKPAYSRFASETLICPGAAETKRIQPSHAQPWVAQQFIAGQEYSTYSIAQSGRLLAHCSYRSTVRAGKGSGICFHAVDEPRIAQFVESYVAQRAYTGQIGFDFIVDAERRLWVIEGNPRATSGVHLMPNDDSLPAAICGQDTPFVPASVGRKSMVGIAMFVFGAADAWRHKRFLGCLWDLCTSRDVLFRWDDPGPLLGLPLSMLELIWIALRERRTLQQASTFDIEWNGESVNTDASEAVRHALARDEA